MLKGIEYFQFLRSILRHLKAVRGYDSLSIEKVLADNDVP
jgi:hypothetical protein